MDKLEIVHRNLLEIPQNKRDINRLAGAIIYSIIQGEVNALETDLKLRFIEDLLKQVRTNLQVKEAVQEEAERHPEKTFAAYGGEITKTSRGSYDYSVSNDSYYNDILKKLTELNDARKEREKLLQSMKEDLVIEETGEVIKPPLHTKADGLRVKLL